MLDAQVYRRKLKLKAKFEGGSSYYSFKRLVPGAFNLGLTGSACTASPRYLANEMHPYPSEQSSLM